MLFEISRKKRLYNIPKAPGNDKTTKGNYCAKSKWELWKFLRGTHYCSFWDHENVDKIHIFEILPD